MIYSEFCHIKKWPCLDSENLAKTLSQQQCDPTMSGLYTSEACGSLQDGPSLKTCAQAP